MTAFVSGISTWSCKQLEESLLPINGSTSAKVANYGYQFFKFCCFLPLSVGTSLCSFALSRICPQKDPMLVAFAKHPEWKEEIGAAPVPIGFATSDFQDNGPFEHLETNWGRYYQNHFSFIGQLPDIWNYPERVINRLQELGVEQFHFSVSRDKIEPQKGQPFDPSALSHYRNFCRQLKNFGIQPLVSIHHFTDPTYFSWEGLEDRDGFVAYATAMAEFLYKEGVRKILVVNEPSVIAFQGWVMGEFPPHRIADFEGAARVLENLLRAHAEVYALVKTSCPDMEIGVCHNPIRFRYFHKNHPLWSPVERLLCHYLTEITHTAVMRLFQTGEFSLRIPFRTNYTFSIPNFPMDFIGLQYYTDPLLQCSFSGVRSVAREIGLTTYQYRAYPQGLSSALEECRSLKVPIDLTEIGIDTGINKNTMDRERILYFDKIFQVVEKALTQGIEVRSLYFWTLIDNLEWHKAWKTRFGFYRFHPDTGRITPRLAALWLRDQIAEQKKRGPISTTAC